MIETEGNYQKITFSNSGRYLLAIRENDFREGITSLELYDFLKDESKVTDLSNISVLATEGSPLMTSFSPFDKYLIISEKPTQGGNTVRIFEFKTGRCDSWHFKFAETLQYVRDVVWCQRETYALLHVANTNTVHCLVL